MLECQGKPSGTWSEGIVTVEKSSEKSKVVGFKGGGCLLMSGTISFDKV